MLSGVRHNQLVAVVAVPDTGAQHFTTSASKAAVGVAGLSTSLHLGATTPTSAAAVAHGVAAFTSEFLLFHGPVVLQEHRRRDFVTGHLRMVEEQVVAGGLRSGSTWIPGFHFIEFVEWQFLESTDADVRIAAALRQGQSRPATHAQVTFTVSPNAPAGVVLIRAWGY